MVSFRSPDDLPDYVAREIASALNLTGYPLVVQIEEGDAPEFNISFARGARPFHVLRFCSGAMRHHAHFHLASACVLERFWSEPPPQRLVPAVVRSQLPTKLHLALLRHYRERTVDELSAMSQASLLALTTHVTTYPQVIRVESDIAERFPQHRSLQRAYFRDALDASDSTYDPEVSSAMPDGIRQIAYAMIGATIEENSDTADLQPGPNYLAHGDRAAGNELRRLLHECEVPGYRGDRRVTDSWARHLGIRRLYRWTRLD